MEILTLIEKVKKQKTKFIVVTGGVCSSLGKGILVSAIGVLLKKSGYSVSVIKWDPYLNVDPGTMSPLVHGEVFVTDDGAETDLDLGHYERILDIRLTKESSVSSGQIYQEVLDGEREGKYLGKDIQMVPDVVNAIKRRLYNFSIKKDVDFVLVEIGGTIGDMEIGIFLEAVRQVKIDLGNQRLMLAHLSLVPYLKWAHEIKTKPTQHSIYSLRRMGLAPDALFLRTDYKTTDKIKNKLFVGCGINRDLIFDALTVKLIPEIFLDLDEQDVNFRIQKWFGIQKPKKAKLLEWKKLIKTMSSKKDIVNIALVAKYVGSNDPYISIINALMSAGNSNNVNVNIEVVEAEKLEKMTALSIKKFFAGVHGILVPGGFDSRGVEGKIVAARYARKNNLPYLGICLGMQIMIIEFARSILDLKTATSTEFNKKTRYPVIGLIEEQKSIDKKGGTMRLGVYKCSLLKDSKVGKIYGKSEIFERHRHRYEFNNFYKKQFEKKGMVFSGIYKKENLVEISEIKDHPFMIGTQFHPEYLSKFLKSHPLFKEFIKRAKEQI